MKTCVLYITIFLCLLSAKAQQNDFLKDSIATLKKETYLYKNQGDFTKAISTLNKAVRLAETIENNETLVDLYNLYTELHYDTSMADKAKAYIETTKGILNYYEYKDGKKLLDAFEAYLLAYNNEYERAISKIDSVKTGYLSSNQDITTTINFYEGMVYFMASDFNKSQQIFEKMLPVEHSYEKEYLTAKILLALSQIYFEKDNLNNAEINAGEALRIARANNFHKIELDANRFGAKFYEAQQNYEHAYRHIVEADRIQMQYFDPLIIKDQDEAASRSQSEFLNRLLDQYQSQLQQKEQTVNISKLTSVLSSALLIIISLLTISLYRNNQIKFKTNDLLLKKNLELQAAKDEAEKAMKAKAQFLSTVSHELRTPLYAVTGLTHLLLEEDPRESQKEHLKSLKFSGEYLLNFINDILQINKIEANKLIIDNITFNLRGVLSDVANSLQQTAKENKNKIVVDIDDSIPASIIGDPLKLSQIFMNLVGNALKFTEKGNVTIVANTITQDRELTKIHFEVIDQGIGISKEMQESIFDSFSQGSVQINRKYGGTGLGLTIVKSLLTLFGSEIRVDSELGKGSSFKFDIEFKVPESAIIETEKAVAAVEDGFFDQLHLLIVEDNKINQVITQKMLAKKGMTCDIASDGYEAIEKAKRTNYDCILMDIHMPGISGLKATQEIRKFNKMVPIIALTAISLDESKENFFEAGCNDVVTKPFKPDVFYKKIAKNIIKNINISS